MNTGWNILLDPDPDAGGGTPSVSDPVGLAASADASPQPEGVTISRADYDQMQGRLTSAAGNDAFHERIRSAGISDFANISDEKLQFLAAMDKNGFTDYGALGEALEPQQQQQPYPNGGFQQPQQQQQPAGVTEERLMELLDQRAAKQTLDTQYQGLLTHENQGMAAMRKELGLPENFSDISDNNQKALHYMMEGYRLQHATGLIGDENHPHNGQLNPFTDVEFGPMGEFFKGLNKSQSAEMQFEMAKNAGNAVPTAGKDKLPAGDNEKIPKSKMTREQLDEANAKKMADKIDAARKARGQSPMSE